MADYELKRIIALDETSTVGDTDMFAVDSANGTKKAAGATLKEYAVGDITDLTTTDKSSVVAAINEVDTNCGSNATNIGTLSNLTTTDKTDIVSAVNEVDGHADTNATSIGTLANLTTTDKTDLVSAVNEVDGHADTNATSIGTLANLTTTDKTDLVSAVNEVKADLNERLLLLDDNVPNTVQTYTFTNGSVSKVEHKSGNTLIRSDVFTYGETTITETRTLNTGAVLTIVTNLTTLETSVTYTAA